MLGNIPYMDGDVSWHLYNFSLTFVRIVRPGDLFFPCGKTAELSWHHGQITASESPCCTIYCRRGFFPKVSVWILNLHHHIQTDWHRIRRLQQTIESSGRSPWWQGGGCQHSQFVKVENATVDGRNPSPDDRQVVYSYLFHYLQGFIYIHPRWCRSSSINSITYLLTTPEPCEGGDFKRYELFIFASLYVLVCVEDVAFVYPSWN